MKQTVPFDAASNSKAKIMHFQLKSIGCLSYPITHHAKRTATLMWQPLPKSITYLFCA